MISPTQLQHFCSQHKFSPVFFKLPGTDDIAVSLDGTYPNQGLSIHQPERLKVWTDSPDYPDPTRPWRPYIPRISDETPEDFRWIILRLFRWEAYRMVTHRAPFRLTEEASLPIARSVAKLSLTHEQLIRLFPWLSEFNLTLPPLPRADLLHTKEDARNVQVTISLAGLEALDLLGFYVFCSYNHHGPLGPSPLDDVLSWSRHELRGVVLDLETTTFQELVNFVEHRVPVYYICRRDSRSIFPPELINAKDRDGELEKAHHHAMSARRASKARARGQRQAARQAGPSGPAPVQQGKRRLFLKYKNRFKQVSKNIFGRLERNGSISLHKLPTGIVDILDLYEEPTDDEGFSDKNPIPDTSPGQSSHTRPPPLSTSSTRSDDEPELPSRIPSPPPRPSSSQQPAPCPPKSSNRDGREETLCSRSPRHRSRSPPYPCRPHHHSRPYYPPRRSRSPRRPYRRSRSPLRRTGPPPRRSRSPCRPFRRFGSPSSRPYSSGPIDRDVISPASRGRPLRRDVRLFAIVIHPCM